ncbi:unnamed protein product, partial [Ascophyllum nodosum]
MVVSRCATELREGAPVCSAMPNAALYQRFVCRVQGYPDAAPKPPVDERCVGSIVAAIAPLVGPETRRILAARSRPAVLLHGPATAEGSSLVEAAAERLGLHVRTITMRAVLGVAAHGGTGGAMGALRQEFEAAREASPCVLHLRGIASVAGGARQAPGSEEADERLAASLSTCLEEADAAGASATSSAGGVVVLVGSAESLERVPASVRRCFTHEVRARAPLPSEKLRLSLLKYHLKGANVGDCVTQDALQALARRLLGRSAAEIRTLVSKASDAALARFFGGAEVDLLGLSEALERVGRDGERSSQTARSEGRSQDEKELVLTLADLEEGEKRLPPPASTMKMGCPKIPQVKWDDVGGLGSVKREILDMIELPLKHPEVFGQGVKKRAGILLYGPPGTG